MKVLKIKIGMIKVVSLGLMCSLIIAGQAACSATMQNVLLHRPAEQRSLIRTVFTYPVTKLAIFAGVCWGMWKGWQRYQAFQTYKRLLAERLATEQTSAAAARERVENLAIATKTREERVVVCADLKRRIERVDEATRATLGNHIDEICRMLHWSFGDTTPQLMSADLGVDRVRLVWRYNQMRRILLLSTLADQQENIAQSDIDWVFSVKELLKSVAYVSPVPLHMCDIRGLDKEMLYKALLSNSCCIVAVNLGGEFFDPTRYNSRNGANAAETVVAQLRSQAASAVSARA